MSCAELRCFDPPRERSSSPDEEETRGRRRRRSSRKRATKSRAYVENDDEDDEEPNEKPDKPRPASQPPSGTVARKGKAKRKPVDESVEPVPGTPLTSLPSSPVSSRHGTPRVEVVINPKASPKSAKRTTLPESPAPAISTKTRMTLRSTSRTRSSVRNSLRRRATRPDSDEDNEDSGKNRKRRRVS